MSKKKEIPERTWTQWWEQFLASKHEILYQYELAKKYSKSHIVQTSHGNVAESLFRKWLGSFLPKKYAITSWYIISQNLTFKDQKFPHYDVIIYDNLNSPVLWIEENNDHSEGGKARAIPAEYVKAVFEVKANLTTKDSLNAITKLSELIPLIRTSTTPENTIWMLPNNFITASIFFELQKSNEFKKNILNNLVPSLSLPYFGWIVLKGEGRNIDDTWRFTMLQGDKMSSSSESLIFGSPLSDWIKVNEKTYYGTMLGWSPAYFSMFVFDLIAILEWTFRPGYTSSWYWLSWLNPERKK